MDPNIILLSVMVLLGLLFIAWLTLYAWAPNPHWRRDIAIVLIIALLYALTVWHFFLREWR